MIRSKLLPIIVFCLLPFFALAQLNAIDHWETVVLETDTWHYFVGDTAAPPVDWQQPSFDASMWQNGQGGIGYADGDDNTIIPNTLSLFMRLDFNIIDSTTVISALLNADYDDAFVAYLNGHEIARANIGTVGTPPLYTDTADIYREAVMYQGGNPSAFFLTQNDLNQYLNQGNNTLAIQVHNHSIGSSDLTARFFFSVGLNDTAMIYNPVPSWFVVPFLATNLPVLKINTNGQTILQEMKITAEMQLIDNGFGNLNYLDDLPNGYNGQIGIEIRGASSTMFDKKGFGIETRDSLGDNNNVSLLGMPSENDWVLHGPYSDKSLLRNFLTFHIGNQMGNYTPKVRFCELFLDDQYWGVYVLMEKIKRDNNRVDIANLSPTDTLGDELTGGYIFKIDREMGPDNGWFSPYGYGYYAYHHPNAEDLHPLQKSYIQNHFNAFESTMASANFNNPITGYRSWIDVPSFIDYMMIQEITRNIDAYRLSAFMYKDKDSNGGKVHAGPIWDYNLGYGNTDLCDNGIYHGWAFQYNQSCGSPFPFFWSKLVSDASFRDDFNCRWQELRANVLHTDTIHHFIDSMVLILNDAQIRNFEKWNVLGTYVWPNAYVGQTYAQEVQYLKVWIRQRLDWMDLNMIGNGNNCTTATKAVFEDRNFKVYPNPFKEYLSFEIIDNQSLTIEMFDVLGKKVTTLNVDNANTFYQINTNDLQPGIYFYTILKDNQIVGKGKVIKAN
jgi:hypothetical protein